MRNSELLSLIVEAIELNILAVVTKEEKRVSLIGMGIDPLVELIQKLGFTNNTEYLDTNGCDMDFTYNFEKGGQKYQLWGSLVRGIFMFSEEY